MVQDTLNPEYYVGAYQRPDGQWITTKFSDPDVRELEQSDSHSQPIVWERRPIVLVPIPGLSRWAGTGTSHRDESTRASSNQEPGAEVGDATAQPAQSPAQVTAQRPKRERSSDADQPQSDAGVQRAAAGFPRHGETAAGLSPQQQPPLEDEDSGGIDTELAGDQGLDATLSAGDDGMEEDTARPRTRRREDTSRGGADVGATAGAGDQGAGPSAAAEPGPGAEPAPGNTPTGEVAGSCIAYLYDSGISPRLHEVVQVVGVVSHMPQLASLEYDTYGMALESELASLALGQGQAQGQGGGRPQEAQDGGQSAAEGGGDGLSLRAERLADEAMRAAHPPTSKVMRIHAVLVRRSPPLPARVPATADDLSAAAQAAAGAGGAAAAPHRAGTVGPLRERALGLLRMALGGDAVAAEYVLLQLLSRVSSRGDAATLGQLALNLSKCPAPGNSLGADTLAAAAASALPGRPSGAYSSAPLAAEQLGRGPGTFASALHAAISCLVPLSVALPLTLEAFNRVSWGPSRDPVRERTLPSPLQLAPGTVVLLDETVMAPGHFSEKGFKSFQALSTVARRQQLMYDFETTQHPVPVDLPLIVLTEGRSLLRDAVPLRLPLNATQPFPTVQEVLTTAGASAAASGGGGDGDAPTAPAEAPAVAAPPGATASAPSGGSAGDWAPVRAYLATAARDQEGYELAEGMAALLERYFVDARRGEEAANNGAAAAAPGQGAAAAAAPGSGMTPEEFHMKLTLARLVVLSHGERQLTRERWQQLLQLEHTREARLRVVG